LLVSGNNSKNSSAILDNRELTNMRLALESDKMLKMKSSLIVKTNLNSLISSISGVFFEITLSENEKIAEKKGVMRLTSIFSKSFVKFRL
jgi:hypothetical protein